MGLGHSCLAYHTNLSNTAVVMLFINVVKMCAKKLNIKPSKMLIPLSYAAGLGGVCTIIGSATCLVVAGLYLERTGTSIPFFEPWLPWCCLRHSK